MFLGCFMDKKCGSIYCYSFSLFIARIHWCVYSLENGQEKIEFYNNRRFIVADTYGYIHTRGLEKTDQEIHKRFLSLHVSKKSCYIDVDNREQFAALKKIINKGDLVIIDNAISIGKNEYDIMKRWYELRDTGADVQVLSIPHLDTRLSISKAGDISTADMIMEALRDITVEVMSFRKEKQMKGILDAKTKGIRFGRVMDELPPEFDHYAAICATRRPLMR